ncbi:Uncharacterised protein [Rhodococcus rhodochrous]|uniref:hypothetical protein n=1 Tax=Rhodococcus rhodochrous TaxID=1829 RepID=UPI000B94A5B0|nr:hypothetical protein [Rhodococcus rhodochrous]SNV27878.1 Uncharacterised protein [Rhodococcus rhodochrous]
MSEPILSDWAAEGDDADSSDTTKVLDFFGPPVNPASSVELVLTQHCSTRAGSILYYPIRIALAPDVHGHEKVPTGGRVTVPTGGGQMKVPASCSS